MGFLYLFRGAYFGKNSFIFGSVETWALRFARECSWALRFAKRQLDLPVVVFYPGHSILGHPPPTTKEFFFWNKKVVFGSLNLLRVHSSVSCIFEGTVCSLVQHLVKAQNSCRWPKQKQTCWKLSPMWQWPVNKNNRQISMKYYHR